MRHHQFVRGGVCILLSVLLMLLPVLGQARRTSNESTQTGKPCCEAQSTYDRARALLGNNRIVQNITGFNAFNELEKLRKAKPDGFNIAIRRLQERGYLPTEHVLVQRTVRIEEFSPLQSSDSVQALTSSPQSTMQDTDTLLTMWSWDDGDDSTWEGTIYVESLVTGESFTSIGQMDISQNVAAIWWETTHHEPGGNPQPDNPKLS